MTKKTMVRAIGPGANWTGSRQADSDQCSSMAVNRGRDLDVNIPSSHCDVVEWVSPIDTFGLASISPGSSGRDSWRANLQARAIDWPPHRIPATHVMPLRPECRRPARIL